MGTGSTLASLFCVRGLVVTTLSAQTEWERADSAVVRLAPAAFSALPLAIRHDLERRGCTIRQVPFVPAKPHNVIRGAFAAAGNQDWAVLCSIDRESRILVYPNASVPGVIVLEKASDKEFLQGGMKSNGAIGFSHQIAPVSAAVIRGAKVDGRTTRPRVIDHQGIADEFVDKGSNFLYYYHGKWLSLRGSD